ncbi:MAG: ribosome biogenesis/translation initiation ATPase RLI [Thermoplasmatales archaeon]|nr:ribosome biogenesis/translation initiation ATPase RLI [Thermoplasmatales archaeon]
MRIAVLLKDRCQPRNCASECIKYCPRVRSGDETIIMGEDGKPVISEELCVGCGICVHKCPFDAIKIIGLPEELKEEIVHQFGKNGFRLFRLPVPKEGQITGILGPNGIGKTTAVKILSGELIPNMGHYRKRKPKWELALEKFAGTEVGDYLKKVADEGIKTALKPQYVDKISDAFDGKVKDLLKNVNEEPGDVAEQLEISSVLNQNIKTLSGGELQRVAIAATMLKEADVYFFDEPSSYLDIYQRLKIAKVIRKLSETKQVVVIEHDIAILDFLADNVHLMYGVEGAYGVVTLPKAVRNAINIYLSGFLKEENIRFRDREIIFEGKPPRKEWSSVVLMKFDALEKKYDSFSLKTKSGIIHNGEIIGIVGPNATGKTTFVKMLAGAVEPSKGKVTSVKVSYKPQYLRADYEGTVKELLHEKIDDHFFKAEIERPLNLKNLYNQNVKELSGGEIQRVAVALALSREADIYLIDEPSAYLDSNQRMETAKTIRRVMEKTGKSAMIVDHDVYFIDMVSDSIMVFSGEARKKGLGVGPFDMKTGMNMFLKNVEITFRRDGETNRPRINKPDSRLDREQKEKGEYYYT